MSRQFIHARTAIIALGCVVLGSTVAWSNLAAPADSHAFVSYAFTTKVNFDQVFADASALSRPDNTPVNREKLRNAGWKRINGSH